MRGLLRRLPTRVAVMATAAVVLTFTAVPASAIRSTVAAWSPITSPGTYDYGTLTAGQGTVRTFTLTNPGDSATSALHITLTGSAGFTMTADACTATSLGPDKTCQVAIAFHPSVPAETDQATLTAATNKSPAIGTLTLLGGAGKAVPTLTTSPSAGGTVGVTLSDTATLAGGYQPTGTIAFDLFPTSDCSGAPVDTQPVNVSDNGSYATPIGDTTTLAGTYQWTATYSGDGHNSPVVTGCGSEQVTIAPAAPTLTTSPSPGGTVGATTVTDTALLAGGYHAGGTITFNLYSTADCSGQPVYSDTVQASGDAAYTPPGYAPVAAGTYQWIVSYSGNVNNRATASGCGTEPVTITAATPTLTTSPGPGGTVGLPVSDSATLSGAYQPTGTLTFNLYSLADCSGQPVDSETISVSGNGSYSTTSTPTAAGTYQWTVGYSGDANNAAATSGCDTESVTLTRAAPTLTTSPSPSGNYNDSVTDTATLTGGAHPTGTITFELYNTSTCSNAPVLTQIVTVNGDGSYSTTPAAPGAGDYEWTAGYSGDSNNNATLSACGSESVTLTVPAGGCSALFNPDGSPASKAPTFHLMNLSRKFTPSCAIG